MMGGLVKAETGKCSKYFYLAYVITYMGYLASAEIIPIVLPANGLTPANNLRQLNFCRKKAVLLDTVCIVRRFLKLSP